MKTFETNTSIAAKPEKIWAILTNAAAYPEWNKTVVRVEGTIELGNKITVHARISPGRAFPVKVATLSAPQTMVWSSAMPLGLFKGERTFKLVPSPDGTVNFSMREEFTGFLEPMISKSIPDLQPEFEEFAACLKRAAESA